MACIALGQLGFDIGRLRALDHLGLEAPAQGVVKPLVAGEKARFNQGGADNQIGFRGAHTFI